jgi:hypothetical protein
MVESTDRSISDANSDVPRVLERGFISYGAYSAYGSLYRATATVVLKNVLASSNPIIDCYHYTSGGGTQTLNRMNYSASSSTGTMQYVAFFYLTTTTYNGRSVVQINFEHIRPNQLERGAYYIVYSSAFSRSTVL